MNANLRTPLLALFLMVGLLACTDHRLRPLSPLGFRLKTVEIVNGLTTTFNYDSGNRVESYSRSNGGQGLFYYDDQSRYLRYDVPSTQIPGQGERARFTYLPNTNGFNVNLNTYISGSSIEFQFEQRSYGVDDNKRVTGFTNNGQSRLETQSYEYTGDNITTAVFTVLRTRSTRIYEFDNKPNPYYGLIVPGVDDFITYSRNNITKVTTVSSNGSPFVVAEYVYEYNERGLPTRVINKDGTQDVRFTYESF